MQAENFTEEWLEIGGAKIRVTLYKIGAEFHCHVYNADPGATIARASSINREDARAEALGKAQNRLLKKSHGS